MTAEHIGDRLARLRRERELTQEQLAEHAEISVEVICRLEQRRKHGARTTTWLKLARALGTSVGALLDDQPTPAGPAQTPPHSQAPSPQGHNEHDTASADGGREDEPTKRRDAVGLSLAAAVTPELVGDMLHDSAADAVEFTRHVGESGVGAGTLEHLEAAVTDLSRAYAVHPAAGAFAVARAYRGRVQDLLNGQATLKERRQLYVYAAWLDELLAWLAQDLGAPRTARAYAIDCFAHADQAGHDELCGWAATTLAEVALYARQPRPDLALAAARRGIEKVPTTHPLAVRLRAYTATSLACQGNRDGCRAVLAKARQIHDRLPAMPTPLVLDPGTLTDWTTNAYPVSAYLWIGDFEEAERHAREAISARDAAHARSQLPDTGQTIRADLAIALVHTGAPDEAIAEGQFALASPRGGYFVRSRAGELDAALTHRYPDLPQTRRFHEEYRALIEQA